MTEEEIALAEEYLKLWFGVSKELETSKVFNIEDLVSRHEKQILAWVEADILERKQK